MKKFILRLRAKGGGYPCTGRLLYVCRRRCGFDTTARSRDACRFDSPEEAVNMWTKDPLWRFVEKQGYEMDVLAKRA